MNQPDELPDQIEMVPLMPILTELTIALLSPMHADQSIVEIGVGHGNGSTRAFNRALQFVPEFKRPRHTMVDVDHDKAFQFAHAHLHTYGVCGDSRDRKTLDAALKCIPLPASLIYIDTEHTYDHMKAELEVWVEIAGPDTLWLFHDTHMWDKYNPMTDAIKEYADQRMDLLLYYHDITKESHGLGTMTRIGSPAFHTVTKAEIATSNAVAKHGTIGSRGEHWLEEWKQMGRS